MNRLPDGLIGLPDAINAVCPQATVQLCAVHLIRASLRYASTRDWAAITKDLRLIYTAVNETAAERATIRPQPTRGGRD